MFGDAGLNSEKEVADFFHVTERTVKNWRKNNKPPRAVFLCLSLMAGKLDGLGDEWKGFKLTPEAIESPEGDFIYSYEIRAIKYVYQAAEIERFRTCLGLKNRNIKPRKVSNVINLKTKRKTKKIERKIMKNQKNTAIT